MIIAIGTLITWSPFNRLDRIKQINFSLFSIGNMLLKRGFKLNRRNIINY